MRKEKENLRTNEREFFLKKKKTYGQSKEKKTT